MIHRRTFLAFGATLFTTSVLSACAPTQAIEPSCAITGLGVSDIRKCLIQAGEERGWIVTPTDSENHLQATYVKGPHSCVIDILYNEAMFTIRVNPKTSSTLRNSDGTVHRKVNQWINNYRHDAQTLLTELQIKKSHLKSSQY